MQNKDKWIRLFIVLGISSIFLFVSLKLIQLLYPFLIAILLVIIINPIVNVIIKYTKLSRGISVFLTMILLIGGIGVGIFFLSIEVLAGIQFLIKIVPPNFEVISSIVTQSMNEKVLPTFNQVSSFFNELSSQEKQSVLEQVEKMKDGVIKGGSSILEGLLQGILSFVQSLPNLATAFLFGLLGTFFISKDWDKLKEKSIKILPEQVEKKGSFLVGGLKAALVGYIKAQAILIAITVVILIISMFVLRVEHALTIGLIIGLVDILPYLGTGLVLIPWAIYSLLMGETFLGVGLLTTYLIITVVRQLIEPKVLSSTIGLNTLATLVAMYVGIVIFGFLGLIIGPVTLVIITTLIRANVFKDIWHYIQNGKASRLE